jgi:hypothetical protein
LRRLSVLRRSGASPLTWIKEMMASILFVLGKTKKLVSPEDEKVKMTSAILNFVTVEALPALQDFSSWALDLEAQLRIPNYVERHWPGIMFAGVISSILLFEAYTNREALGKMLESLREGLGAFYQKQFKDPAEQIVREIIAKHKVTPILDQKMLEDSKTMVRNLLDQFLTDMHPDMSETEHARYVEEMDISCISREFEHQVPRAIRNIIR